MGLINGISDLATSMNSISKSLSTTSNNIANVDTPGYVAQKGEFTSREIHSGNRLINGGIAYQIQDMSILAKSANQQVAVSLGEKTSTTVRNTQTNLYSPILQTNDLSGAFADAQNPQNGESSLINLNKSLKEQVAEFLKASQSLQFGAREFQRISEARADAANEVYREYQRVGTANPNDPRVQELEQAYAELAGWPPAPPARMETAQGGELKGLRDATQDLQNNQLNLSESFTKFAEQVNSAFTQPVIGGDANNPTVELNGQQPTSVPNFNYDTYNFELGKQQTTNNTQQKFAEEDYLNKKAAFDQQYGVNLEQELTKTVQLQRHYEAMTKLVQVHDQMLASTINMKT